jgi:hypothetical protein
VDDTLGIRLVEAIAAQDRDALAGCFAPDAELRALIPPGLRERTGAVDAAALVSEWFADSSELELLDSRVETVGDRLHIAYRFAGIEQGEPYVVEHQLYCTLSDEGIASANLLCSGFRPRS